MRDAADRYLVNLRRRPGPTRAMLREGATADIPGFRVTNVTTAEWAQRRAEGSKDRPHADLLEKADAIAANHLTFFDLENQFLGNPIDWNRDFESGRTAPMLFAPSINYRDHDIAGDCKFVWEPNRHHQFVVLGRAYRASGDIRYAEALITQMGSWLDQCPYGLGMNWRSPLELGIRLINWVWALSLIRPAGLIRGKLRSRLLHAVSLHIRDISRKYSQGSSANNHLIGEAAGVFIATSYFRELRDANRRREESREILCRQMIEQVYPDGGSREQAMGYHRFVMQLFALAEIVGDKTGRSFPAEYRSRLEKMFEFAGAMVEGGDTPPMFGDCDDGYVLDLGGDPLDVRPWMAVGSVLFDRDDFSVLSGGNFEPVTWLHGSDDRRRLEAASARQAESDIRCRAFPDTGYYLLQTGRHGDPDRISLGFDCGKLGYGSIAAHGHADALSITLRAFGQDVLVDPGTYDYFTHPAWRDYFRSTRAHNTAVVDGQDQSEMLGAFLWGRRASARCLTWEPRHDGGEISAEHDGYTVLRNPVLHRRTVTLDGKAGEITISDHFTGTGRNKVEIFFHLAEQCRIRKSEGNTFEIDAGPGSVTIELDRRLSTRTMKGSEDPIGGWVSRGYHCKVATPTLVGSCSCNADTLLVCRISVGRPKGR